MFHLPKFKFFSDLIFCFFFKNIISNITSFIATLIIMFLNIQTPFYNFICSYTFKIFKFETIAPYTGTTKKTYVGQWVLFLINVHNIYYRQYNFSWEGLTYFLTTEIIFPFIIKLSSLETWMGLCFRFFDSESNRISPDFVSFSNFFKLAQPS